jgi:hypothetical protein
MEFRRSQVAEKGVPSMLAARESTYCSHLHTPIEIKKKVLGWSTEKYLSNRKQWSRIDSRNTSGVQQ